MEKGKNLTEDQTTAIWNALKRYHDAHHGPYVGLYKTESIQHEDGKYQPGTEEILYMGDSKDNALAVLETAICEEGRSKIVSKFVPAENRWELIKEE